MQSSLQKTGGSIIKDGKKLVENESKIARQVTKAANMHEVFDKHPVGKLLKGNSERTKLIYDGCPIYRTTKKIPEYGLKEGDFFYLDKFHGDHLEVFAGKGNRPIRTVLNLDGSENIAKLNAAIKQGRKL